jgi:hypothetical protein
MQFDRMEGQRQRELFSYRTFRFATPVKIPVAVGLSLARAFVYENETPNPPDLGLVPAGNDGHRNRNFDWCGKPEGTMTEELTLSLSLHSVKLHCFLFFSLGWLLSFC